MRGQVLYLGSQEVAELQASDDGDFLCLKILVRKMALRASHIARPASSEGVTGGCMDRTSLKVGLNRTDQMEWLWRRETGDGGGGGMRASQMKGKRFLAEPDWATLGVRVKTQEMGRA